MIQQQNSGKQAYINQSINLSGISSTSSYSQIIPRNEMIDPILRDRPIIIKSIPVFTSKKHQLVIKNTLNIQNSNNEQQNNSEKNLKTADTETYKQQNNSVVVHQLAYRTGNQQQQLLQNQLFRTIKKTNGKQYVKTNVISVSGQQYVNNNTIQEQSSVIQNNANILNYSLSSLGSQRPQQLSPKQSIQWNSNQKQSKNAIHGLNNQHQHLQQYSDQSIKQDRLMKNINNFINQQQQQQTDHNHEQTIIKLAEENQQLKLRLCQLQQTIKKQLDNFQLQRQANQIYTEFYSTLFKVVERFLNRYKGKLLFNQNQQKDDQNNNRPFQMLGDNQIAQDIILDESVNMDKITQTVTRLTQFFINNNQKGINTNVSSKNQPPKSSISNQTQTFMFQYQNNQNLLQKQQTITQLYKTIQQLNEKNQFLKKQLLKSIQNNINTIFNTQISAACCLENQVKKINTEMGWIKEKIDLIAKSNHTVGNKHPFIVHTSPFIIPQQQQTPPQIIYLPQPNFTKQLPNKKHASKMTKIYTQKDTVNESQPSESQQSIQQSNKSETKRHHFKRQDSLNKNRKRNSSSRSEKSLSSSSSISSRSTKKREQMSRKQIQQLKQAYSRTKNELNSLINTFSLISSSQNQMRQYFHEMKEGFMREINVKMEDKIDEKQSQRQRQKEKQQRQRKIKQQQQYFLRTMELERQLRIKKEKQQYDMMRFQQLVKQKQLSYQSQVDCILKQRQHDQQVIKELNSKIVQLTSRVSVPQKVTQQFSHQGIVRNNDNLIEVGYQNEQQVPMSVISVSVDVLRAMEKLRKENYTLKSEIQSLQKSNEFMKNEIEMLNNMVSKGWSDRQRLKESSMSRQRKESIINGLKGCSLQSVYPLSTLPIKTKGKFLYKTNNKMKIEEPIILHSNQSIQEHLESIQKSMVNNSNNLNMKKMVNTEKNLRQLQNNQYRLQSSPQVVPSNYDLHKDHLNFESQQNIGSNIRTIISSKQAQIDSLQKQVSNLQQTIKYLKQQLQQKDNVIHSLDNNHVDRFCQKCQQIQERRNSFEFRLKADSSKYSGHLQPEINVNGQMDINNMETVKIKMDGDVKYENYVKNLKLLLSQSQKENSKLKEQLFVMQMDKEKDPDSLTQSNYAMKQSATYSERTTKNLPNQHSASPQKQSKSQAEIFLRNQHQQKR